MRILLLFLALFLSACDNKALLPLEQTKELIILTRVGATTYTSEGANKASGFDYDLAHLFADELGLKIRIIIAKNDETINKRLKKGDAHLAAAWQTPSDDPEIRSSAPYFESRDVLITHETSLPITEPEQLAHKKVHVIAGSRQEALLLELQEKIPELLIVPKKRRAEFDLMEGVSSQRYEAALVNKAAFDIGNNAYPDLQDSIEIGSAQPIVWRFAPGVDPKLIARADSFIERIKKDGTLDRLKDRYFGHIARLTTADNVRFIELMRTELPRYRALFHDAQITSGIDWRLLAALAYQESKWNPLATSPTGVRGMMMLTEDTADHLRVSNRLDPAQSIKAGAAYLNELQDSLPPSVREPDRMWLALAAYNLGMGHLNAGRYIAKSLKRNPDAWYEMKQTLPLLAQPQYYSRLKSGRGRGGEAVILVENIRVYYDILKRYEAPYTATESFTTTKNDTPKLSPAR